ncbi:MAG TPA: hypothetical protein PKH81_09480, partial [Treponemataceae bacterium]|nr:hypothetical protein [Treponemataceae bacterium]
PGKHPQTEQVPDTSHQGSYHHGGQSLSSPLQQLAISGWIEWGVHIPGQKEVDVQVPYRAMDYLLERREMLGKMETYFIL